MQLLDQTQLDNPQATGKRVPRVQYDLRIVDAKMTRTQKNNLPRLGLVCEIVAPASVALPGKEPVETVGVVVYDGFNFSNERLAQLEADGGDASEIAKCKKSIEINNRKLGYLNRAIGLSNDIPDDPMEIMTTDYLGKTFNAICASSQQDMRDEAGQVMTDGNGQPLKSYKCEIVQIIGPARWPDEHPPM